MVLVHTPFTTSDLFNWKANLPPFRESPQQYVDLFQRIFATHKPTVPDIDTLLSGFLGAEDKRQVLKKALEEYTRGWKEATNDGQRDIEQWPAPEVVFVPSFECDVNTDGGYGALLNFHKAILHGIRTGVPKTVNYYRVNQIFQTAQESPTDFINRLKDGFRCYTDIDPDSPASEPLLKMAFVAQSAPDIRRKLQKLVSPSAQTFELLIQTAFGVYAQREEAAEGKEEDKMRKQAQLLAVALQPRQATHGRDQCALCKAQGHWKGVCPKNWGHGRGRSQVSWRGRRGFPSNSRGPPPSRLSPQAEPFHPKMQMYANNGYPSQY